MYKNGWDYLENERRLLADVTTTPFKLLQPSEEGRLAAANRIGEAWSNLNREFEASNPTTTQRLLREISPITGVGGNMGSAYDNFQQGNDKSAYTDLALIPLSVWIKGVKPSVDLSKGARAVARKLITPNMRQAAKNVGIDGTANMGWGELSSILNNNPMQRFVHDPINRVNQHIEQNLLALSKRFSDEPKAK